MVKCAGCKNYMTNKEGASCCKCEQKYHLACVRLPRTEKVPSNWKCEKCRERTNISPIGRMTSSNYDTGNSPTTFMDAADVEALNTGMQLNWVQEIGTLRTDIRGMRDEILNEIGEFRREMTEMRNTLILCTKRIDTLESRLEALEKRETNANREVSVDQLEQAVSQLQRDLNDREQDLLASDLVIANLPENPGENVLHTVELVAKKLGVTVEARDIVFAEREGPRTTASRPDSSAGSVEGGAGRGRRIVVRLARRGLRDELLRSARVRRGATSADLGLAAPARRFYLNERLTRTNKQLFYRTRQTAAQLGWRYTWTKRGRIYTKQGDGKQAYNVRTEKDFERVFGKDNHNCENK